MDIGTIMLVAAWLTGPPEEARRSFGLQPVEYIGRYQTIAECVETRDRFRRGEYSGRYRPEITFHCIDMKS